MLNLFGRRRDDGNDFTKLRQKQIDEFQKQFPSAKYDPLKSTYDVVIQNIYGRLPVSIQLAPQFPEHSPIIHVQCRCKHAWIDSSSGEYKVVTQKLKDWTAHTSLTSVVNEIIFEFNNIPPVPINIYGNAQANYSAIQSPSPIPSALAQASSSSSTMSSSPSPSPTSLSSVASNSSSSSSSSSSSAGASASGPSSSGRGSSAAAIASSIPQKFEVLDSKSISELNDLLEDESYFLEFLSQMNETKSSVAIQEEMLKNISQHSEKNLKLKSEIDILAQTLTSCMSRYDISLKEFKEIQSKVGETQRKYGPGGFSDELSKAIDVVDEQSEKLKEDFERAVSDKGKNSNEEEAITNKFVEDYMKLRVLLHERQAKRERLTELIAASRRI